MNLHLSKRSPLNSTFSNDNGQTIYKVETPLNIGARTSTITRVVPNDVGRPQGGEVDMQDRFGLLAQIIHKPFSSSILKFNGVEMKTKDCFRNEGLGVYGRHRAFTAPDGKVYRWLLGIWTPKLILNDGSKTPVSRFRRRSLGIIGKAHPARLEILPAGEGIMDTILVTFIYIEKIRKDKERAARESDG